MKWRIEAPDIELYLGSNDPGIKVWYYDKLVSQCHIHSSGKIGKPGVYTMQYTIRVGNDENVVRRNITVKKVVDVIEFKLRGQQSEFYPLGEYKDSGVIAKINGEETEYTIESNVNPKVSGSYTIKYKLRYRVLERKVIIYEPSVGTYYAKCDNEICEWVAIEGSSPHPIALPGSINLCSSAVLLGDGIIEYYLSGAWSINPKVTKQGDTYLLPKGKMRLKNSTHAILTIGKKQ